MLQGVVQKDKYREFYKKFSPSVFYFVRIVISVILFALNPPHDLSAHAKKFELLSFYISYTFLKIYVSLSFVNYGLFHRNSKECLGKDSGRSEEMTKAPGLHARLGNT